MRTFRWGDLIILALAALLALGAMAIGAGSRLAGGSVTAEVWQDGRLVRMVALSTLTGSESFDVDGAYHNHIEAEPGRIRFTEADCPDRTCVHTGWIAGAGQIAACVPNRVIIKIVGQPDPEEEEDTVVR